MNWLLAADRALLLRVRSAERAWVTPFMKRLTVLGNGESWTVLSIVLLVLGEATGRVGLTVGCAAMLATALSQPLKRICRRARPSVGIAGFSALADNPDAFSFPSGHTAAAVAVAVALIGSPLVVLAGLFAAGVGVSRVYLGAHYPVDVLVGAGLGVLAGALTQLLLAGVV